MIDKDTLKNELTIDQVFGLVAELGGDPRMNNGSFVSRTICHGGDSHKLYYYNNTLHSLCQYFFILFCLFVVSNNCSLREEHVFASWYLCVCEKLQSYEYSKMRRCTIATAPSKWFHLAYYLYIFLWY